MTVIREHKARPWMRADRDVLMDFHGEAIAELMASDDIEPGNCGCVAGVRLFTSHGEQLLLPACYPMPRNMVHRLCALCVVAESQSCNVCQRRSLLLRRRLRLEGIDYITHLLFKLR